MSLAMSLISYWLLSVPLSIEAGGRIVRLVSGIVWLFFIRVLLTTWVLARSCIFVVRLVSWLRGKLIVAGHANSQRFGGLRREEEPLWTTCIAAHNPTLSAVMATIDQRELDLFAVHASASFTVRHPDRSMLVHCLFSRLPQQILDTLVDVGHPLLLLCCCGSEHCEGLAPCTNEPTILELSLILQGF